MSVKLHVVPVYVVSRIACYVLLAGLCVFSGLALATNIQLEALTRESKQVGSIAEVKRLDARLAGFLDGNINQTTTDELVLASDVLGDLVSKARELEGGGSVFKALISRSDRLHERCREKVRLLEQAAGDNESALEHLYRSDLWHDINYALSASGYWKAWAALAYAGTLDEGNDKVVWLNLAANGFKVSSVRILYPGIVHGSWLGLGYVEQTRGDLGAAEKRFRRLSMALSASPENSVRKLAEAELTMMAIRRGELQKLTAVPKEALSPSLAGVLIEEAFLLLEQHRQTSSGAIGAGTRLKKVIADGFVSDALMARILSYRDEIVGQDLGVVSLLVDAEFAYAYQQYLTTVFKYQAFREARGEALGIDTSPFQYHYSVALMKTDLPREAQLEVERIQGTARINASVAKVLPKFAFSLAQASYQQKSNADRRKRLVNAAKAYIRATPADADIARAHLALAEVSQNSREADRHLRIARSDRRLRGDVALSAIRRDINRFNQAVSGGNTKAQRARAERIMEALGDLGRRKRKEPWFRAVSIQMRTILGRDLPSLSREVDVLLADKTLLDDARVRSVLFWSKLRILDALGDEAGLSVWIKQAVDEVSERQIYQFLLEKERVGAYALVVQLAADFYPALAGQAQDQRQLRLLQIRSLSALGQADRAFDLAQQMVQDFSGSGDAWRAYAEAAEQQERWFEAERAWVKIASATPEGSPQWRGAQIRRIELFIRAKGDGTDTSTDNNNKGGVSGAGGKDAQVDFCSLLAQLVRYAHLLKPERGQWLERQQEQCESAR